MDTSVARLQHRAVVRIALALFAVVVTAGAVIVIVRFASTGQYLARDHDELVLDGRPYRYAGQTVPGLAPCGPDGSGPQDAELDRFFAALPPRSMVRTWATQDMRLPDIERVVAAAGRHRQLLTLVLVTSNGTCPALDTGVAWDGPELSESWYREGYRQGYLAWLRTIAKRFRDDPAVGIWELLSAPGTATGSAQLRSFYDAAGATLHKVDPHHLVASGARAPWVYGGAADWRLMHESPGVDVATIFDFDMNVGPSPSLEEVLAQARRIGKPLVIADLGVLASRDGDTSTAYDSGRPDETRCVSWAQRVRVLRAKLDASFVAGVNGVAVRGWRPGTVAAGCTVGGAGWSDDPLPDFLRDYRPPPPSELTRMAAVGGASGSAPAAPSGSASQSASARPVVSGSVPPSAAPGTVTVLAAPSTAAATTVPSTVPITQVGTATTATDPGDVNVQTHQLPSGTRAGDQILAAVELYSAEPLPTVTGFELVAAASGGSGYQPRTLVYRRTAQAGDTRVVVTFANFGAKSSSVIVYRGVSTTSPIVAATTGHNTGEPTVTMPGVDAPVGSRLVVAAGVCSNDVAGSYVGASDGLVLRAATTPREWTGLAVYDQAAGTGSRTVRRDAGSHQSGVLLALRRA